MMDRRTFLRRAAILATGAVAVDQLDLLDRLGWVRRLFPSAAVVPEVASRSMVVTMAQWDALLREDYVMDGIVEAINAATPFKNVLRGPRSLLHPPHGFTFPATANG